MKIKDNKIIRIVIGILLIGLAICTFINFMVPIYLIQNAFVIIFAIVGIALTVSLISNKPKLKHNIVDYISPIIFIVLSIFLFYVPDWFWRIVPILFGIWSIINSLLCAVTTYIYKNDEVKGWLWQAIYSILYLMLGVMLIISPIFSFRTSGLIIGIYVLFFGVTVLRDCINPHYYTDEKKGKHRRKRVLLPIFLVAFVPQKVMNAINEQVKGITKEQKSELQNAVNSGKRITRTSPGDKDGKLHLDNAAVKRGENVLEVFVHMSENTAFGFGHCDICFNNTVISYGCYDEASNRLFGTVSDGVLVLNPRKEYIRYCLEQEGKILVGFELNVTDKQVYNIKNQIKKLFGDTYRWYCDLEQAQKEHMENSKLEFNDPASTLHRKTGAIFYKFKKGKFKTYFVTGANCVRVADFIVGASGIDSVGSGIITPGTYYAFLDDSFRRQDGVVKSEHVYLDPKNEIK